MAKRKEGAISAELLDQLLAGRDASTAFESDGLMGDLKEALAERMLNAEMDDHLANQSQEATGNHRNGTRQKTVMTGDGQVVLDIPRDRHGAFDPALIPKYRRRFPGFDDKRGMSTRDIQTHVGELYGVEISANRVSVVTEAVMAEITDWQNKPLEAT